MIQNFDTYSEMRVPRYTSYPTALQFTDAVTSDDHQSWLNAIQSDDTLSLYIHIPFCHQLCWYCGCNMSVPNTYARVDKYLEALLKEIGTVEQSTEKQASVIHIHFGGGSPSYLKPEHFTEIMDVLRQRFSIAEHAEIAVEVDPRSMNAEKAKAMATAGVNRISMGVQDFDPDVQARINRIQPFGLVEKCIQDFRDAGINNISLDLMYGLPLQTTNTVEKTARQALSLSPSRISLFGYAHVPWFKKHQKLLQEDELPGKEERKELEHTTRDVLIEAGMIEIGFDHYAVPGDPISDALAAGKLKRNFQGYTDDAADYLIAFGCSAISRLPGGFVQNAVSTGDYIKRVGVGGVATLKGVDVSREDRLRSDIIMDLMCNNIVDVGAHCLNHGFLESNLDEVFFALMPYIRDGICSVQNRVITILPGARPLVRVVAAAFDVYLKLSEQRHSKAI